MNSIEISKVEARRFLTHYHGLNGNRPYTGEKGILDYMHKVGCIQYDPLNVVGRNADLVLQARIDGYKEAMLESLLYNSRDLVDGWDKMMAIYSVQDIPYFKRVREAHTKSTIATMNNRGTLEALDLTEQVKSIIREEGPKLAREINIGTVNRGRWGHGKLSSVALDYLYTCGELVIHSKKRTQKVYDLADRILPDIFHEQDPFSSDREFYKWYIERRIGSVGMLWGRSGGGWLGHFISNKKLRSEILDELVEEKRIVPMSISGKKELFYMRQGDVHEFNNQVGNHESSIRIIAPLDNLLWDRAMIKEIFDFEYTWEVYIPKAKRKFGYYVLPVLYKDRFIARFEPKQHRANEPLAIHNWWWEDGIILTDEIKYGVDKGLKAFYDYLNAEGIDEESRKKVLG